MHNGFRKVPDADWLDQIEQRLDAADARDNVVPLRQHVSWNPAAQPSPADQLLVSLTCDALDAVTAAVWPEGRVH